MKIIRIIIASYFICQSILFAQQVETFRPYKPNIIPPSAEAAVLGGAVETPVSFYAGKASLNIPFFNINYAGTNVGIGLSYQGGGGIAISQVAPAVGIGWALNAGGVITRSVLGATDDREHIGFLDYSKNHSFAEIMNHNNNNPDQYMRLDEISHDCGDGQPDIFYFNFNGYSGKFVFDWDGNIVTDSKSKLKIEKHLGSDKKIKYWTIIDDQGIIYEFEEVEITIIQSATVSTCDIWHEYNSAWYLTKIHNPNLSNANEINFEYDQYVQNQNYSYQSTLRYKLQSNSPTSVIGDRDYAHVQTHSKGRKVTKIYTSQHEVNFDYDIQRNDVTIEQDPTGTLKSLDKITIRSKTDGSSKIIKTFDLTYNYSTGRLSLESITEKNGSLTKKPYLFYYNSRVPEYTSQAKDHWGYFNGKSQNNSNPIPTHPIPNSVLNEIRKGANKEVDPKYTASGTLSKITYPTGGYKTFSYEPNEYSFIQSLPVENLQE